MRILVASQYYRPAYDLGGTVTRAVAQAEGLAKLGHQVEVVTSAAASLKERFNWRRRVVAVGGVRVHYLAINFRFRKVQIVPGLPRWARSELPRFDVLHVIGYFDFLGPVLSHCARRRGLSYSVAPSGMLLESNHQTTHKSLYDRLAGKRMLIGARNIVFTSPLEMERAVGYGLGTSKMVFIPNGTSPPAGRTSWIARRYGRSSGCNRMRS